MTASPSLAPLSDAVFGALLEAVPDAMVCTAADGRIALLNAQAERLFGYQRTELIGQPVEILVPDAVRATHPGRRAGYVADPRHRPLGEEGRGYAERIVAVSEQMGQLIDYLLLLSRISRTELHRQSVDLGEEAARIAEELQRGEPDRRACFAIARAVQAHADRRGIRTVLHNLLDNAWKFTSGRDDASIEFGTAPSGDAAVCCYVRDNGAGFDPAYAGSLFQPFRRLHGTRDFPGNGTGLATMRQIVELHGGRVWAEGAVGAGATFYFTLDEKKNT